MGREVFPEAKRENGVPRAWGWAGGGGAGWLSGIVWQRERAREMVDRLGFYGAKRGIGVARWRSRGYLPHLELTGAVQHVTFHLGDSLPGRVLHGLRAELERLPESERDGARRERIEAWMDSGYGSCVLRLPWAAELVEESLLRFDGERYRMMAWVVMPNHVHALLEPMGEWTVGRVVASWKKWTARAITGHADLAIGGAPKPLWHREYWDRYIRNEVHFDRMVGYIHENPVKAGLVRRAEEWRWSSAFVPDANQEIGVPRVGRGA